MYRNENSNKSSIVTTIVVLLVCLVLVTGSTFSLFTSKTGTNIAVTSGNVEMVATIDASTLALYSKGIAQTGKFENGGTAAFNDAKTELTLTNITPGDSVEFDIVLENKSTVDLQYRVNWIVTGDLAEALTATVGGADITSGTSEWTLWKADASEMSQTLSISIELPLEADDNWESLEANIAFNVEAVQANATGEYSPNAFVNTATGLQAAVDAGATEITLNESVELTDTLVIPAAPATYSLRSTPATVINLNGKTITAAASIADSENCVLIMNRGNLVITNGTINVENATAIRNHGATANLVLENMTVTQTGSDVPSEWLASAVFTSGGATTVIENGTYTGVSSAVMVATSGGNLTINGGTFTAEKTAARVDSWSYNSVLTINDGTFNSANKALYADGNKYVTVNGGTFNATIDSTYTNIDIKGGTFNVSIKQPGGHQNKYAISGGTFVDDVNKYVANGYSAVDNLDGTYTVLFPQESFDSLIENAGENATIEIPAGNYTFPASDLKAGQTLNCAPGTVFEGSTGLNANGATIIGATFSNPTGAAGTSTVNGYYKNCTFDGKNGLRWCYAGDVVVFENCVFSGDTYGVHFDGGAKEVKFIDCTFSGFNAIAGDVKLTMEGCTFEANGRSNYNGINLWGSATLTNCTFVFDGKAGNEWVDARGSNTTLTFTGCVVTDGETTKGLETVVGNGGTGNTIIIDGVEYVYTADELIAAINAAEDGATIYLTAGDYALRFTNNTSFNVNNLTIKGMGDVNLAISSSEAWYGRVQGSNVIFENIHFTSAVGATGKATYNNCTFDSWAICASSNKEETYYNNCTINGCLNTSTDFSSGDIYVKGCKIAMAEYSGSMTVNFENCEIGEVIIWNSNTNFTSCEITTLNDDNVTSATVTIK